MLADQEGTQHTSTPPFNVLNYGKNQSIPLITLDNSYSAWMWDAWGDAHECCSGLADSPFNPLM